MRFLGIKMVNNIIFGFVSWNNHHARCKAYTLVNSQKNCFFEVGQLHTHYSPLKHIYKAYISYFLNLPKLQNEVAQLQIFLHFLTFAFALWHMFRSSRGNKNSLRYAYLNLTIKICRFLYTKTESTIALAWYIYGTILTLNKTNVFRLRWAV